VAHPIESLAVLLAHGTSMVSAPPGKGGFCSTVQHGSGVAPSARAG